MTRIRNIELFDATGNMVAVAKWNKAKSAYLVMFEPDALHSDVWVEDMHGFKVRKSLFELHEVEAPMFSQNAWI